MLVFGNLILPGEIARELEMRIRIALPPYTRMSDCSLEIEYRSGNAGGHQGFHGEVHCGRTDHKREMVRDEIKGQLKGGLKDRNILVDEFNIVNFEFSKNFNDAIEAKVTAEQQALAAKNKLEQIKFEADQKIAEARGKGEAMTIESNALKSEPPNPGASRPRKMERYFAASNRGAIPFINLPK